MCLNAGFTDAMPFTKIMKYEKGGFYNEEKGKGSSQSVMFMHDTGRSSVRLWQFSMLLKRNSMPLTMISC